jgi:hypothetical protein
MIEPLGAKLGGYFYYHGARGAFLKQLGRAQEARAAFDRAIALANTPAEAAHIRRELDRLAEEKRLRALAPEVNLYLDFALASKGVQRHVFLRRLLALSQKMTARLFIQSIERAHHYGITTLDTIERIALLQLREGALELPLADLDETYRQRPAYQEGALTDLPDLTVYENPPGQDYE